MKGNTIMIEEKVITNKEASEAASGEKRPEEILQDLTPTQYFDLLKGMKKDITEEDILNVLNNCLELMEKPKKTGQKKMAKKVYEQSQILLKELQAVKAGFNIYILREDILYYIENIAKKTVKIIEMENYERDIPDDVVDKLVEAQPYFDEFFIVFTDYTGEAERTVEKEKRDKDPILFGVIHHPNKDRALTNRMYFIADWVDEYCDLTLEELCLQYEGSRKQGIKREHKIPTSLDELKAAFEAQEHEPVIEINRALDTITLTSKNNSDVDTAEKPKRTRKKKTKDESESETTSKTKKKTTRKKDKK
jgi:hypothetical protein